MILLNEERRKYVINLNSVTATNEFLFIYLFIIIIIFCLFAIFLGHSRSIWKFPG